MTSFEELENRLGSLEEKNKKAVVIGTIGAVVAMFLGVFQIYNLIVTSPKEREVKLKSEFRDVSKKINQEKSYSPAAIIYTTRLMEIEKEKSSIFRPSDYLDLGRKLKRIKEYDAAIEYYRKALRLDENSNYSPVILRITILREYGDALYSLGKYEEGKPLYFKALNISSDAGKYKGYNKNLDEKNKFFNDLTAQTYENLGVNERKAKGATDEAFEFFAKSLFWHEEDKYNKGINRLTKNMKKYWPNRKGKPIEP